MAAVRCPHPADWLVMVYCELREDQHGRTAADFPVWECRACGADLPDGDYLEEFRLLKRLNNTAAFNLNLEG